MKSPHDIPAVADRLEDIAAAATLLARGVAIKLPGLAGLLPDGDRTSARLLARAITNAAAGGTLFDDRLAQDLASFVARIEALIARGTRREFMPETSIEFCGVGRGGWFETFMTFEAQELSEAFAPLRRLNTQISLLRAHAAGEAALFRLRQGS